MPSSCIWRFKHAVVKRLYVPFIFISIFGLFLLCSSILCIAIEKDKSVSHIKADTHAATVYFTHLMFAKYIISLVHNCQPIDGKKYVLSCCLFVNDFVWRMRISFVLSSTVITSLGKQGARRVVGRLLVCPHFVVSVFFSFSNLNLVTRKPLFGVCDQVRLKPACLATEADKSLQISDLASKCNILSRQRTTKAPLLFAYGKNRFFHDVAYLVSEEGCDSWL